MNMRSIVYTVIFGFSAVFGSTVSLATAVMVKKKTAVVRKDPMQQGVAVATLKKGDVIKAVKRMGTYWQVALEDGKVGYISIFKVKRTNSQNTSFARALRQAVKSDRTTDAVNGVRARSSVMGVRGLSDSEDTAFAGNVRPNHLAVYEMEDTQVKTKQLRRFEFSVQKELHMLNKRRQERKVEH